LIKNAESLEKLHKVNTIIVDKTGTITKGKPEVTDILGSDFDETELLKLLASLEKNSEHPLAVAICEKAKAMNIELEKTEDFENIEGKGLKGKLDGKVYYAGNPTLMKELKLKYDEKTVEKLTKEGKTPVLFSDSKTVLGLIAISDTIKEASAQAVAQLHKLGIKVVMLTGDNQNTAEYIAKQVGIDKIFAEVLPEEKASKIKDLQNQGLVVAMAGDGVNDAPALAQSDVGIAMGTGTDVAIESADITLLAGDIGKIPQAIKLSKRTMRTIKQNLFWAFFYNIIGIPIAAGLLYPLWGILLNPVFAGLAMAFSSVSVVSNSLRLKFTKID
jgi:heavy metal translocating P-type ATPase